jgi:hypothetical protein
MLFCLALGIAYGVLMYFRDKRFSEYSAWLRRGLAIIRSLGVALISLLLLSPFIRTIKEDIKTPLIVIANDVSESILEDGKKNNLDAFNKNIQQLATDLSSKYEVKRISFGSDVYADARDSLNDKSTNISNLFRHIADNYGDQNLGAVVMTSDGIYNEGSNPLYSDVNFTAPLYTIALGDTLQKKDIFIQNVLYNKIAYLGDKFPVQVDVSAFNCDGSNSRLTLEMINGTQVKKIAEESILLRGQSFYTTKTFLLDASQSGVVRYRLRLSAVPGEFNSANNVKEFFVEILDARQKVLLLANAPHPDLAALKNIITTNKNYDAEIVYMGEFSGNISKYNLIILHNLPSEKYDLSAINSQIQKNKIPTIFIVGMQTSLAKFNQLQNVISINGNSKNTEDIQAELNTGFNLFTTSDHLKNTLKTFPPLQAPFGEYKTQGTSTVYLFQNIKKIKTTYPLVAFGEQNDVKTTVIAGEGIWKWRLFDHLQNKNYDLVSELINKTILLTTVKTDKRKFRASSSKNLYQDNESILFDAQLYNDSYEMVNEPDVKLIIKDDAGKEYRYTFSKTQNYYTLNADLFPQGVYSYVASVVYNGKELTAGGRFNVESLQLEQFDLTARHGLLKGLAEKYNGSMYYPAQLASLKDMLINNKNIKPVLYESKSTKSIINLKWLFFLILGLLTLEWFLRRYFGNY